MDVFDLVAKITLDDSGFNSALGNIKNGFSTIAGVGVKAVGAATAAVGAFTASAVKAGAGFDTSMSQVAATMGYTVDEINKEGSEANRTFNELREYAQEMGRTTMFSASQSADALNYMALAGYDAQTSIGMLPNVLNLAAAGSMDLASASDMVTDAASALGMTLEDGSVDVERVTKMIDGMAVTASKSNTSVTQLGSAMLTIGGTAKQLHGGFVELADGTKVAYDGTTELSAALGILADNGVKGSEGGTALRNVLNTFSGNKFAKTFGEMGVAVYDASGEMRSMKDILKDMNGVMEGMTTEEKTKLINSTFNSRDLKNVNALLATTTDRWDELTLSISDAAGAAEKMAGTQMDNLAGDVTYFKSAWEGLQIAISDTVKGPLREFVQFGSESISKITDAFKTGGLTEVMVVLGEVLSDGLNMIIEKVPEFISAGGQLLGALGKGLMDNIDVILWAAGDVIEMFMNGMLEATSGNKNILMEIINWILGVFNENYTQLMNVGMQILINIFNGITAGLPDMLFYVTEILTTFGNMLIENLPLLLTAAAEFISTLAIGIADALPTLLPVVIEVILAFVEGLVSNIGLLVNAAIQLMLGLTQGITNALPILISKLPELVQQVCTALIENLPLLLSAIVEINIALTQAILDNLPLFLSAVLQILVALVQLIIQVVPQFVSATLQIIRGIGKEITKAGSDFLKKVGQSCKEILAAIVAFLMELPGKMAYWAGYAVGQFIYFFATLPDKAKTVFNNVITKAAEFVREFPKKATEAASGFTKNIEEGLKDLPGKMLEFGKSLVENIFSGITGAWDWLKEGLGNLANNLFGGIVDGIKAGAAKETSTTETSSGSSTSAKTRSRSRLRTSSVNTSSVNVSARNSGSETQLSGVGGSSPITINVYATSDMDERALAREVSYRLEEQQNRAKATWRPAYA